MSTTIDAIVTLRVGENIRAFPLGKKPQGVHKSKLLLVMLNQVNTPKIDEPFAITPAPENYGVSVMGPGSEGWTWYTPDAGTKDAIGSYILDQLIKDEGNKDIIDNWLWLEIFEEE